MRLLPATAALLLLTVPALADTALDRHLPDVKFNDVALQDALEFFRDSSQLNLVVDWKALELVGVSKDTPVSLNLRKVKLRLAIRKTLEAAAPGLLTSYRDGNVLHVTTQTKADEKVVVRIYPVHDLLHEIPDFAAPQIDLSSQANGQSGGSGGGGGSGGLFGQSGGNQRDTEKTKSRAERAQDLIDIIQSTIRPEIWTVNGGRSTIRYLNGVLIVKAPRSVQEAID